MTGEASETVWRRQVSSSAIRKWRETLGHRILSSTLVYTHLVSFESDEFVCKVAKTVKEAQELVESGFDYVCDVEGFKVFRKRK